MKGCCSLKILISVMVYPMRARRIARLSIINPLEAQKEKIVDSVCLGDVDY